MLSRFLVSAGVFFGLVGPADAAQVVVYGDGQTKVVETNHPGRTIAAAQANGDTAEMNQKTFVLDQPRTLALPGDPLFARQWMFSSPISLSIGNSWDFTQGQGAVVGVIDSGIDGNHPDLQGSVVESDDLSTVEADDVDANGHGTHVAGIISGNFDNAVGMVGVAPQSSLVALKAVNADGSGLLSDFVDAANLASYRQFRVVNVSLGFSYSEVVRQIIADSPNTLFVVAAGNSHSDPAEAGIYPCAYDLDNVLCVGSLDSDGMPSSFSNFSPTSVDLFAPGGGIVSTYLNNGYATLSGTSMAAPTVSGAAALLLGLKPDLTTIELKTALMNSVTLDGNLKGLAVKEGYLNVAGAINYVQPGLVSSTLPTPAPAPTPLPEAGPIVFPSAEILGTIKQCKTKCRIKVGYRIGQTDTLILQMWQQRCKSKRQCSFVRLADRSLDTEVNVVKVQVRRHGRYKMRLKAVTGAQVMYTKIKRFQM